MRSRDTRSKGRMKSRFLAQRRWFRRWAFRTLLLLAALVLVLKVSRLLPPSRLSDWLERTDERFTREAMVYGGRTIDSLMAAVEYGKRRLGGLVESDEEAPPSIHIRRSKPPAPSATDESRRPSRPPAAVTNRHRGVMEIRTAAGKPVITSDGRYIKPQGQGTGFVVWRDDFQVLVVTAAHVVGSSQVEVELAGRPGFLPADVVKVDSAMDLALLRLSKRAAGSVPVLDLAKEGSVETGAVCWILTSEAVAGAGNGVLGGHYLGSPRELEGQIAVTYGLSRFSGGWLLLSQATHRGFSGAPVLDGFGRVMGVLAAGVESVRSDPRSLAVGSGRLRKFLRQAAPREFR